jgi:Predicted glycosyl hydrolase
MMKFVRIVILIFIHAWLFTSCYKEKKDIPVIVGTDTAGVINVAYKDRAKQVYDNIITLYSLSGSNLLKENYPAQPGDPAAAYFWSHTSMLGGAMLLKSLGFSDPSFQKLLDGMEDYWDAGRKPAAYQSSPVAKGPADRFYDDNAIAGLDMLRAYEQTGDAQYLDKAEKCLAFDMSGESDHHGGGLFWNEQYRLNNVSHPWSMKAANVTALAANLALRLHEITGRQEYLTAAQRWYEWVKLKLQDPGDKIIWNSIAMKDGSVNTTKWTYNTGAMITNACYLYKITQDAGYLTEAKALAKASYDYFTRPVGTLGRFFPAHDPWFTMILLRGYMDLYALDKNDEYINTMIKNVDYAWLNSRNADGLFAEDWSGQHTGRYYWILTQECMVEIYALISKYKNE